MTATSNLTLEQFLAMPDTEPAGEYVCGEVIQKPMPDRPHAAIQGYLLVVLFQFLTRTKLGRVFPEFRCIFGPPGRQRAFVPDLVYIAHERLTPDRYHRAAPDLAVEVLSPDQNMARFVEKTHFYLLNGLRLVWVIDPPTQTVVVLAPGQEPRTVTLGDTLDGGDVLPGFSVPVDDIFAQAQL